MCALSQEDVRTRTLNTPHPTLDALLRGTTM